MDDFTRDELMVLIRALRHFAESREARRDYDSAEMAEDLADRAMLVLEDRRS